MARILGFELQASAMEDKGGGDGGDGGEDRVGHDLKILGFVLFLFLFCIDFVFLYLY